MSFEIQFEPLPEWPLPDTKPRSSPQFRAGYEATIKLLKRELGYLDVRGAVALQVVTGNGHADLRRDGMLMQRAKVIHPGVRISFESKYGPLSYASDAFEERYYGRSPDWQANLRAIALGLESLRAVDRYGITRSGEQYKGWQQIASSTGSSAMMDRGIALAVLREESGDPTLTFTDTQAGNAAWRQAIKHAHPDRNNGDDRRWNALTEAAKALGVKL